MYSAACLERESILLTRRVHWSAVLFSASLLFLLQSELRVRHREECKNVTRLTMENVRKGEN
jgi:hypothetical protein